MSLQALPLQALALGWTALAASLGAPLTPDSDPSAELRSTRVQAAAQDPDPQDPDPQGSQGQDGSASQADERERELKRSRTTSKKEFDRLLQDDEALARGRAAVDALLRANGGLVDVPARGEDVAIPLLSILPGVRFDLLEVERNEVVEGSGDWKTHNMLPRMLHFGATGDGYAYSEFTRSVSENSLELVPSFRREIVTRDAAWGESEGALLPRGDDRISTRARQLLLRELICGLMPHGFSLDRAKLAYMRTDETPNGPVELYAVRLDHPINFLQVETASDFVLYVDRERWSALGMTYTGHGLRRPREVRLDFLQDIDVALSPEVVAQARQLYVQRRTAQLTNLGEAVDAEAIQHEADTLEFPAAMRMPYRRSVSEKRARFVIDHEVEDVVFDPLPPAALARPWLQRQVWIPPDHADFWDPPSPEDRIGPVLNGGDVADPATGGN